MENEIKTKHNKANAYKYIHTIYVCACIHNTQYADTVGERSKENKYQMNGDRKIL